MRNLRSIWARFRSLFRTNRINKDLEDELAAHLEMHVADNVRAGMTAEEAQRQALIKLGGLEQTRDSYRAASGFPFFEGAIQDARFAVRSKVVRPTTPGLGVS